MRAMRLHELGGPEAFRLDEVPAPHAGAGEVRISVHAVGVNYTDLAQRAGRRRGTRLRCASRRRPTDGRWARRACDRSRCERDAHLRAHRVRTGGRASRPSSNGIAARASRSRGSRGAVHLRPWRGGRRRVVGRPAREEARRASPCEQRASRRSFAGARRATRAGPTARSRRARRHHPCGVARAGARSDRRSRRGRRLGERRRRRDRSEPACARAGRQAGAVRCGHDARRAAHPRAAHVVDGPEPDGRVPRDVHASPDGAPWRTAGGALNGRTRSDRARRREHLCARRGGGRASCDGARTPPRDSGLQKAREAVRAFHQRDSAHAGRTRKTPARPKSSRRFVDVDGCSVSARRPRDPRPDPRLATSSPARRSGGSRRRCCRPSRYPGNCRQCRRVQRHTSARGSSRRQPAGRSTSPRHRRSRLERASRRSASGPCAGSGSARSPARS